MCRRLRKMELGRTAWKNGNHKLHDVERSGVLEYDRTANGISGYEITVAGGVVCAADYGKWNWCFFCSFYSCTNFTVFGIFSRAGIYTERNCCFYER